MVSVSRFALLRAFVLISAWSQSLNITWHPSNLRQKGSPHFPCCLHLCVVILVSISVMSALSFPYRVGTPRAFINMASLYIYLCGDDTTRVFYISGVVCVKFVIRQAKVGKRSNQQVCL